MIPIDHLKCCLAILTCMASFLLNAQSFGWVNTMGDSLTDEGIAIARDNSGNIYSTGVFWGTVDFDPSSSSFTRTSNGHYDVFIQKMNPAGNIIWAKSFGGSAMDRSTSITIDHVGNIYTIGSFVGTSDFDPGPSQFNLTSAGSTDMFIQKLDATGNFLWAKRVGGTVQDGAYSIATDKQGDVYVTGSFRNTVILPSIGDTLNSLGREDIILLKMSQSGNLLWAKSFGGIYGDVADEITLGVANDIYLTGQFQQTVDFDPGSGIFNLNSNGGSDVFVQKLDTAGNFIWAKSFGGSLGDYGHSIKVSKSGNIYLTGVFWGTVDFDPGSGSSILTSNGYSDVFIQKLSNSGALLWAKSFGGAISDYAHAIAVDSLQNVFSIGRFNGVVDFDPGTNAYVDTSSGNTDVYIHHLDANGNFIWVKTFGGTGFDAGHLLIVDDSSNVYSTGYYESTVDFDPGSSVSNHTSNGGRDIYIHKLKQSINVALQDNHFEAEIKIYPNPSKGPFTIDLGQHNNNVQYRLIDLTGKIIESGTWKHSQFIELNIEAAEGIYLLQIESKEQKASFKLVME